MKYPVSASLLPLLVLPLLAACDTAAREEAATEEQPASEAPVSQETVLEGQELQGLEEENVVFTLPWVGGPVNREPTAGAEAAVLQEVTTVQGEGFDRVVFRFAEGTFPGYNLEWAAAAPVDCQSRAPAQVGGSHYLRVKLRSATSAGEIAPPAPAPGSGNLVGMKLTCSLQGELEWHLGANAAGEIRIVEMRSPERLVVDLRHPAPGAN